MNHSEYVVFSMSRFSHFSFFSYHCPLHYQVSLPPVGREEIKEIEEITQRLEVKGSENDIEAGLNRARLIARLTGGQSPVDRSVDRCARRAQTWPDQPPSRPWQKNGRPSGRLTNMIQLLVGAGRPTDAFCLLSWFRLLFCFGVESNQGFLNPWDSVAINKG